MAMLKADFRVDEARRALGGLATLVALPDIKRAVDKVYAAVKRRRFISDALLQRYAVPLGLSRAFAYQKSTGRTMNPVASAEAHAACSFAMMAAEISKALSTRARERLGGMIRHNLSLDGDARALQHEFTVAMHFAQRGWDIEFCDLERGGGFDYIVRRAGRLIAHVASRAAGCQYCMAHTIEGAAHFGVDEKRLAAIWEYQSSPLFTAAERVALDFAVAASIVPNAVADQSFQDLRRHWSEEQIVEIVATIAMFRFLNRWNDTMGTPLEDKAMVAGEKYLSRGGWAPGKYRR